MFSDYLDKAQQLMKNGEPFVVALVVNYQAPISAKPGYRALVTADGQIWGWIAGGCSQGIIIEEALQVLKDGQPRLIKITPDADEHNPGTMDRKMTCHSGGTLEVYLEPVVPQPHMIIFGTSATARALCKLSKAMEYQVTALGPDTKELLPEADAHFDSFAAGEIKVSDNTFVIVSTQGEGDELALEAALKLSAPYCAFVASKKKAKAVMKEMRERSFSKEQLKSIKSPAGLDIKASRPEEIALSILAEVVMAMRMRQVMESPSREASQEALDPICGMRVKVDSAQHVSNYQDQKYYFCCAGCKMTFEADPEKYLGLKGA